MIIIIPFQAHQEHIYQEYCANKASEKVQQVESYYKQVSARGTTEIASIHLKYSNRTYRRRNTVIEQSRNLLAVNP